MGCSFMFDVIFTVFVKVVDLIAVCYLCAIAPLVESRTVGGVLVLAIDDSAVVWVVLCALGIGFPEKNDFLAKSDGWDCATVLPSSG